MDREKAIKLRDSVDFKINKIEQNKKKALNVAAEENKKVEEVKKEENEDSDDDGKISQSITKILVETASDKWRQLMSVMSLSGGKI